MGYAGTGDRAPWVSVPPPDTQAFNEQCMPSAQQTLKLKQFSGMKSSTSLHGHGLCVCECVLVCVCVCASEIKPFMCSVVEKRWQYAVEELVPAHTPG